MEANPVEAAKWRLIAKAAGVADDKLDLFVAALPEADRAKAAGRRRGMAREETGHAVGPAPAVGLAALRAPAVSALPHRTGSPAALTTPAAKTVDGHVRTRHGHRTLVTPPRSRFVVEIPPLMPASALMNVMISAARKAGRSLARDFGEVEQLQVLGQGPGELRERRRSQG